MDERVDCRVIAGLTARDYYMQRSTPPTRMQVWPAMHPGGVPASAATGVHSTQVPPPAPPPASWQMVVGTPPPSATEVRPAQSVFVRHWVHVLLVVLQTLSVAGWFVSGQSALVMQPATHRWFAPQMGVPAAVQSLFWRQATQVPFAVSQNAVAPVHAVLSVAVHSMQVWVVALQILLFGFAPAPAAGQTPGIVPVAPGMQPTHAPVVVSQTLFAPPRQAPPSTAQDA